MSRARYYISFNAGVAYSEFWPSNEPKINLVREGDEIFKRWKVDKFRIARTKNEVVFDTIAGMFFDSAYFGTDLLYKIQILGVDKFLFIDPVTSGQLDNQNKIYETTPDPNDEYRPIMQQYDKKWQNRVGSALFSNTDLLYYYSLDAGVFTNVSFDTFSDVLKSVTWINNTTNPEKARNGIGIINTDWVITVLITNFAGDQFDLGLVNSIFAPSSAVVTVTGNGKYQLTCTGGDPVTYVEMVNDVVAVGSYDYQIFVPTGIYGGALYYDILDACINGASYMNLSYVIQSTILWNDALPTNPPPTINTYITANPTNDYVLEAAAIWNYLWLSRTDSFTTAKEDIVETSLKDILAVLRKIRMYWFIDDDGEFRIEHEYYFRDYTPQADITSAPYAPDKPEVDERVYRYEKGDAYSQLNYSEQNENTADWMAYPVNFSATLTTNSVKDISFSSLTTDFDYIRDYPGDASSSGLILLQTIPMGLYVVVDINPGVLTPANYYSNIYLSWSWLFANYYDYFAEAESGTINNGVAHTYVHVKEYLKQGNIKFRMVADFDWKRPFTLIEGTGWVEAAEYSPETGMYKIDVGYNPYTITIYVVDSEDIGTKIVDDDGSTFITV